MPLSTAQPASPTSGGIAEIAFRRIARRKLIERGYHDDAAIEAKIMELLHKGLPIDPKEVRLERERRRASPG